MVQYQTILNKRRKWYNQNDSYEIDQKNDVEKKQQKYSNGGEHAKTVSGAG